MSQAAAAPAAPAPTAPCVLDDRWHILNILGNGAFGEVYLARDTNSGEHVAVKIESPTTKRPSIRLEASILRRLMEEAYFPLYKDSGTKRNDIVAHPDRNPTSDYLVMQLLGKNISDLKKACPREIMSIGMTAWLGYHMVSSIERFHEHGLLHRDIKPANFCLSRPDDPNHPQLYLVDMGLARRWRNEDGAPRALRKKAGFRGTARYASQAAHDGQDLGRVDDLWSLFYLLVEALTGTLPWKGKEKDVIAKVKRANTVPALVAGLPMAMLGFFMHLNSLDRLARPDYEAVRQCMQEMMGMHPSQYPWSDELRHILPEAAPPLRQPPTPAAPQPLLAGKVCAPRGASRATMFLSAKPPRVGPRLADLAFEPYPASLLRTDSGANYAAAPAAVPPTPHLTASHHTVTIDPVAPLPAPVERSLVALKTAALYPGAVGTGLGPGSRVVDAPTAAAAAKGGRSDSGLVNSIKTSLRRKILPERLSHAAPAPAAPEYAAAPDVAMLARRPSSTENTQILIDDTLGVHDVSQFMHPLVTQASMEMTLSVPMPTASPPPPGPSVEKQYQQQTSALPKTFGSPRSWFRKPRPPVAEPVGPAVTKGAATLRRSAVYRPQLVSSSDEGQAGGKSASSPYDSPKLSSLPASGLRAGDAYVTADGAVALPAEPQNMTPQMA